MENWGLWDWTRFICCNHRPLEIDRLVGYHLPKNGFDYQGLAVDNLRGLQYIGNSAYHQHYNLYSQDSNDNDAAAGFGPVNDLSPTGVVGGGGPVMDGLRVQLQRRKHGGSLRSPNVRRSNESQVTLRGWLYRLEGAALKQWKRRWFVLADYCLFYYKDMEEQKLLGSILLPSYKVSPCLSDDGIARKWAFKCEHPNMKTYYLAADTKESQSQWMNSLSLASIMQLSTAFSTVRNQGDGQEGIGAGTNDDEESGFASYQSRRSGSTPLTSGHSPVTLESSHIGSDDKYPGSYHSSVGYHSGSYNAVGLPIAYPSNGQLGQRPGSGIQRSHYVNAPPKPKRQYYDASELYCIPPSAQYHQAVGPAPDLIAHDSYNSNYLFPSSYYQPSAQYPYQPTYDQLPQQYRPSNPPLVDHNYQQRPVSSYSRLPPRPHSADFLERDQNEIDDYDEKVTSPNGQTGYYPQSPPEPPKILPMRPKSSLERYDPYYSGRYYLDQSPLTSYSQAKPTANLSQSAHKEPRPWSDYLAAASGLTSPPSRNDNQMLNSTFPMMATAPGQSPSGHYQRLISNNYGQQTEPMRGQVREESLQRLHEWKQRMLQSPLAKRNWQQQQQQNHQNAAMSMSAGQSPMGVKELPSRPPLPEEYRKFTIRDALLKGANQMPPIQRDRSKSLGDGNEMTALDDFKKRNYDNNHGVDPSSQKKSAAPVSYSSDDEADFGSKNPNLTMNLSHHHHHSHQPLQTFLAKPEISGRGTPDYINISRFHSHSNRSCSITSGDDTVFEDDKETSDMDIRKEDYYKASVMFYQRQNRSDGRESILMSPISFNELSSSAKADISSPQSSIAQSSMAQASMVVQDWNDVGLPPPDEVALAKAVLRRSLRQSSGSRMGQRIDETVPSSGDDRREEGDGHAETYSVKALLKKFNEGDLNQPSPSTSTAKFEPKFVHSKSNSFSEITRHQPQSAVNSRHHRLLSDNSLRLPGANFSKSCVSDSEILDNDSSTVDDDNTIKSAPVVLSPLSSVLADLRKTADVRKEKLYHQEQQLSPSTSLSMSSTSMKVDDMIMTKGALELSYDQVKVRPELEQPSDYFTMSNAAKKLVDKEMGNKNEVKGLTEDDYVVMDDDKDKDEAAEDADDEASRDFDSVNYQLDQLPDGIKLKPGCRIRTYKKPRPEPVPVIPNTSITYQKASQHQQQQMINELMNPNPAYESFEGIRLSERNSNKNNISPGNNINANNNNAATSSNNISCCNNDVVVASSPTTSNANGISSNNNTTSTGEPSPEAKSQSQKERSPNSAPYYYSDLLSEEQQQALQERLAACQSGSPPPLLSRCNALNNTRYLGTTSLQKGDVGRRVNKISGSSNALNNTVGSCNNNNSNNNNNHSAIKSLNGQSPEHSSAVKFLETELNKYEAGHTLQKVPADWKRCVTPDLSHSSGRLGTKSLIKDLLDDDKSSMARRRSRSLEGLVDAVAGCGHIYENLGQYAMNDCDLMINDDDEDDLLGQELLRRATVKHFGETMKKLNQNNQNQNNNQNAQANCPVVPLVERLAKSFDDNCDDCESGCETDSGGESSPSSTIELDSVSGTQIVEKKKRQKMHKRRSKDDLNAGSDSEAQPRPPPNGASRTMQVKPKSLKEAARSGRLCVSTGDLLGKSHEELVLLLIQLRRTQAQLAKTCDQLRVQMQGEEKLIEIEPHKREEHKAKYKELRERLSEYEKQFDMQFPMINAVDNMVKNHQPSDESARLKAASTSVLDQVNLLEDDPAQLSSLQQDRDILEKTLEGVKNKVSKMDRDNDVESPVNLDKLKKQQKLLESELGRVRGLLSHSAKRLEEKAAENAQIEQDVLNAKKKLKQVLAMEQSQDDSTKAACLEAELAHIEQVIDDLHHRKKELNAAIEGMKIGDKKREVIRASPTGLAGSAPLPGKKKLLSTYMETDMDTMESRDLAHCSKNSGSEGEDTPLYENLETNGFVPEKDPVLSQLQAATASGSDDPEELIAQLANEEIIDEQMKQFYGLMPAPTQKQNEIKTVRIVKRENERRKIHFANGSSSSSSSSSKSSDLGFWNGEPGPGNGLDSFESIPPPYFYDDDDDDESRSEPSVRAKTNGGPSKDECNDGVHCVGSSVSDYKTLVSSASLSSTTTTATGAKNQHHKTWRTVDDADIDVRFRGSLNTPDIVKSTIKKNGDVYDEKLIEREIMSPQKIDIPERYNPDDDAEEMSAAEKLKRSMKAEMIRRMLSESTTYEDVRRDVGQSHHSASSSAMAGTSSASANADPGTKQMMNEEKKRRAQLLALNHELAKEVMERSRYVADLELDHRYRVVGRRKKRVADIGKRHSMESFGFGEFSEFGRASGQEWVQFERDRIF